MSWATNWEQQCGIAKALRSMANSLERLAHAPASPEPSSPMMVELHAAQDRNLYTIYLPPQNISYICRLPDGATEVGVAGVEGSFTVLETPDEIMGKTQKASSMSQSP